MSRAETFTATVLVRNTGNESWNDVKGFKFGEQESLDPVLFGLARYSIDDAQDDIPTYGGIFRGRVKTFEIEITAPDISSEYLTHWGMVQDQDSWFGDTIELPISVLQSYHTTEDIKLCSGDSILWNGDFYSQTGSYYDSSFTASGHDSICQLNISVISIDPSVSHFKERFKANYAGAIYQWIDCATSEAIEGETSQYFTATENGDYAVVITEGGCVDTSLCYGVSGLGIKDVNEKANQFKSYPNPVSIHGILNIDGDFRKNDRLIIISINGSLVYEESILSDTKNFSFSPESIKMHEGFYVIQIISDSSIQTKKILVRK